MNWKISLDRYLTTPPDDGFDNWAEDLIGKHMSEEFYNKNEDWIDAYDGQCNKWMQKLFYKKGYDTDVSAVIIERAFKLYKL